MIGRMNGLALRPTGMTRRSFLQVSALAGGGFLIGCAQREEPAPVAAPGPAEAPATAPREPVDLNAFVRILPDDSVTVIVKHLDKGQGVTTGLPAIVAEELDADWAQMRAEFAPADANVYNNVFWGSVQGTGGSSSVANSWTQLRKAAAGARAMLVDAAAERWGVPASEIVVVSGVVSHAGNGRRASFGELAGEAANMTPPDDPTLKDVADFRLIGTRLPRLDSHAKTDGSAQFTIDVDRPDMLVAVVARPPKFGGKVASFDAEAARAVDGVQQVVEIPRGVAVVADSLWSANRGRQALSVDWDFSAAETRGSDALFAAYEAMLEEPGAKARDNGDASEAIESAATKLEAAYRFPFLAHATMEPMNAVVELGADRCDIWTGSQIQTLDQGIAAGIAGLDPSQVFVHTQFAGGSFGRRAVPDSDFVAEAVSIAKAIGGGAVKLLWTREDDMRAGRYRPMSAHRMRAGLDADGNIVGWQHRVAIQSFLPGTPFEGLIENGIDGTAVEGSRGLPYTIPNLAVELHMPDVGVPTLWWRSVGHTHNAYVTEVFFDELAHAAGKDPYELRRALLSEHPRHLAVLDLAAQKAGWGSPVAAGRGRGIALHESFGSVVAEVVDVTVGDDGRFSVDRVVCAVDCGIAVTPDVVRAQMEGGIAYGLSAALREAVTLTDGAVDQGNFDSYRPLRIDEMPNVEVHIVPSTNAPSGVGEPGVPPIAPALANALFAASGKRIRRLPIGDRLPA